ncbi:MAG: Rieske (2Fe-2S) protein [Verrucomicrobiota bacterium]|nr:Rieske (2Fe-2S) protein [Verrucomicrobiota bacterium]
MIVQFHRAIKLADLPEGPGTLIELAGRQMAMFRRGRNVYALDAICPHKQGPLYAGFCDENHAYCPMHGWAFDLVSGECKERAEKSIHSYEIRIDHDWVEVGIKI